jgi:uncharacterized protein
MHYRNFGKTGLKLSVFSLGTMRCLASAEQAQATIAAAIAQGINHLETARGYGKSEDYLGSALRSGVGCDRDHLIITTKLSPSPDASLIDRWIDESLRRLQVNYVDCLAIHGVNTAEHLAWIQAPHGCMKAVHQAIDDGRVRHIGFSTHAPLEIILAAIATDQFEFVNLHYNYFAQRNAPAVQQADAKNMGVFIISPADKGGLLYTPSLRLEELCKPFSPLTLMYRFLLSDPRVTTLSVGAAHPHELTWPLSVCDRDGPLTAAELDALQSLQRYQRQVLGTDQCSQCYACLPCPEDIHIPEVLRLRNLTVAYDLHRYGQYRYQMFEKAGHWFPGRQGHRCTDCGDCLPRCPEQLNIPALLRDTHERLKGTEGRRLWE